MWHTPDVCGESENPTAGTVTQPARMNYEPAGIFFCLNWKLHDIDINEAELSNNSFLFLVWHVIELQRGMLLQQVPLTQYRRRGFHGPSVTSLCPRALSLPGKSDSSSDTGKLCCCLSVNHYVCMICLYLCVRLLEVQKQIWILRNQKVLR